MLRDLGKSIKTAENSISRLQVAGTITAKAAAQAIKAMESTCGTINEGVKIYAQMVRGGMATTMQGAFRIGGLLPVPQIINNICMWTRMANQAYQLLMDQGDRRDREEQTVDAMLKTKLIKEANQVLTTIQTGTEGKARFLQVEQLNPRGYLEPVRKPQHGSATACFCASASGPGRSPSRAQKG